MTEKVKDGTYAEDIQRKAALAMQHGMFIADRVLDVQISSSASSVTVGFVNPAGHLLPALTLKMPTIELVKFAEQILASAKANKTLIKSEQEELLKLLK